MPFADSNGVRLYYEEAGRGFPVVFVHEFADDLYSWEPQLRYFSRRYRCIAFNARGYPPSDVPASPAQYSQAIAAAGYPWAEHPPRIDPREIVPHVPLPEAGPPPPESWGTRMLSRLREWWRGE